MTNQCQHGQLARVCLTCEHEATIAALTEQNARLRTVMIAAAEEIQAHWDAHCDAEGYGPANLMRRLEEGIPSQYGYTAGRFAELEAERDQLRDYLRSAQTRANSYADERDRLREELERARVALVNSRATLERANATPNGPICDTIWHGDCETLFDYMDAAIDAMKGKP